MPFFGGESLNITEKVKIGGYMYDVQRPAAPFPSADCSNVCDGEHNFSQQLIKVVFAGTKVYQDTVFLHEICHAIVAVYCNDVGNDEEKFVEQFAKGLYQVVADNPEIFK